MRILVVYEKEPPFPASDQHPAAERYQVGTWFVDAIGGEPTQTDVEAFLAPAPEIAAVVALRTEAKASAMFAALETATQVQIDAWIEANFPAATAPQKRLFKLLASVAGLYLRER